MDAVRISRAAGVHARCLPAAQRRRPALWLAAAVAAVLAAVLAVAGCGAQAARVALPGKPPRVHLAGAKAPPPSPRGLVLAAYEGYWHATSEALASRNPATARAYLAGYVPAHAIPALVRGLEGLWRRHEIGFGNPVFHVMKIAITGRGTAAVHDCVDLSHSGFQNEQTGQVVGGFGQSHEFMITTLALEHGRWLVTGAIPVVQPCTY
ncbi:MAG TPA: hypothetical protein VF843_03830 [Streptosporangiaceae bacterium]